jgi:hypothetical protein
MRELTQPASSLKGTVNLSGALLRLSLLLNSIKERFMLASGKRAKSSESNAPSEKISREELSANNPKLPTEGVDEQGSANKSNVSEASNPNPQITSSGASTSFSNPDQEDPNLSGTSGSQDPSIEASSPDLAESQVENTNLSQARGSREFKSREVKSPGGVSTFVKRVANLARAGFVYGVVGHLPWLGLSAYFTLSRDYYFAADYLLDMPTGVIHWTGVALGTIASLLWFSVRGREINENRNYYVQVVTASAVEDIRKESKPSVSQYQNATIIDNSTTATSEAEREIHFKAVRIPGRLSGSIFSNLRYAFFDICLLGMLYWASKFSATVGYSAIPSKPGMIFWFAASCVAVDWILRGASGLLDRLYSKPARS